MTFIMEFNKHLRKTTKEILLKEFYNGICPFCDSDQTIIRTSRTRSIQEMGTTLERITIKIPVCYIECKACGEKFTPEHPLYPPKYEYSQAVIEYALFRYHYQNTSGNQIAKDLRLLHHVEVKEATVYSWLKNLSPDFAKAKINQNPDNIPGSIKTITVDGTYFSTGKDIIGKKKDVESLSVTKLKDGRYLLMWWE